MKLRTGKTVRGSASELYSWWSDYTPGVIDDRAYSKVTRKIVTKEQDRIVMDDFFTRPLKFVDRTVVTLSPPDRIEFSSESSVWKARGAYTFRQQGEFAEAVLEADLLPQGLWKIVFALPFVKRRVIREFDEDLSGHLEEFEKDTGRAL